MLDDVAISALTGALNGLAARQQALSDDIANVNTPYFKSRTVAFESQLKQALADGDLNAAQQVTGDVQYSTAAGNQTGNNVNLNDATVQSVNTELAYELAIRATGDRFSLYRSAVKTS